MGQCINMRRFAGWTLAIVLVLCLAREAACGNTFLLGGEGVGWTNTANIDYNQWLSTYQIKIGDTLVFANYDTIDHSIVLVDKQGYETCLTSGKELGIVTTISTGIEMKYTLAQSGQFYGVCAEPGHCLQGMKVAVQVLNTDGSVNQTAAAADSKNSSSSSSAMPMPSSSWASQLLVAMVATFSMALAGTSMLA